MLLNRAYITVNGDRAGDIHIEGRNINVSGDSSIESATGNQDSGEISIRADKFSLLEESGIVTITTGTGKSGI